MSNFYHKRFTKKKIILLLYVSFFRQRFFKKIFPLHFKGLQSVKEVTIFILLFQIKRSTYALRKVVKYLKGKCLDEVHASILLKIFNTIDDFSYTVKYF